MENLQILITNLGTFAGLFAFILMFTEWIKVQFKLENTIWKIIKEVYAIRVISWVVSVVSVFVLHFLGVGWWAEITQWYYLLLAGFGLGLSTNGIFSAEDVQKVLLWIFENLRKKRNLPKPEQK